MKNLLPRAPILFRPVYKDYLWGGSRIARVFGRAGTPVVCAESWEVSAHPNGMSVVSSGPLAGQGLAELCKRHGRALLGTRAPSEDRFPLLFKLIDARQSLSVQVHPSEADPEARPRDIKNECWILLDGDGEPALYAGFRDGVDRPALEKALAEGTPRVDKLLRHLPIAPGERLFIRAGLVHAIGAGCLVYEVQQSADVTYRFYDWDRVDAAGRGRPLHIPQAMRSIDWRLPPPVLERARPLPGTARLESWSPTPFFQIGRATPGDGMRLSTRGESFHVLLAAEGSVRVSAPDGEVVLRPGTSALLPASVGDYSLADENGASKVLVTRL